MNEEIKLAQMARMNAYAPNTNYKVGAILRTKNGKMYTGCNVENNGIQSICAERVAFVKAISEGEKEFECITIVGGPAGKKPNKECVPCGYCRQFMSEFVDEEFRINTAEGDSLKQYTMQDLLPFSYKF